MSTERSKASETSTSRRQQISTNTTDSIAHALPFFLVRYSVVAPDPPKGISLKFAAANSPSFPYFSENRPLSYASKYETEYNSWPYGFEEKLSPYVKARIGSMSASTLFSKWASVDVRTLTGDRDTFQK